MTRRGKPLWFFGWVSGGWIALRAVMLWPSVPAVLLPKLHIVAAAHAATPPRVAAVPQLVLALPPKGHDAPAALAAVPLAGANPLIIAAVRETTPSGSPSPDQPHRAALMPADTGPLAAAPLPANVPGLPNPSRWGASLWVFARGHGTGGGLNGPELGGSQAGLRVTYAIDRARRLALAARVAAPLGERGAEAAFGLEWQPTRLPIRVIADQRVMLDGGRGGPELGLIAGFGPQPFGAGFDLTAYGQAGAIKRAVVEGYVDGAMRLTRPVAQLGRARIELGAGAWGGAQPGTARLDLGPTAALAFPIAGHGARLSFDWRQRVAGHARPGSGPTLTLGADF